MSPRRAIHWVVTETLEPRRFLSVSFGTPVTLSTNNASISEVLTADVNGDGNPDILAVTASTGRLFLSNGNGTFQSPQNINLGSHAYTPILADLTGDGKLDIVSSASNTGLVFVSLGNGNGTFQSPVSYAAGNSPGAPVVGDFNGDGIPDILVPYAFGDTLSILPGNGDGTFGAPVTFAGINMPSAVAIANLTGDGLPDIIELYAGFGTYGTVTVLINDGEDRFTAEPPIAVGNNPNSLAVTDVTGDGKPDIIVANGQDNAISLLTGNGNGTFQNQQTFAAGNGPNSLAIADVNNDGNPDLIVADQNDTAVGVLQGNGNGTFAPLVQFTVATSPTSLAVGDFNGDGKTDVVAGGQYTLSVLINDGQGNSTTFATLDTNTGLLTIKGTPQNDTLGVSLTDNQITATRNGATSQPFNPALVTSIDIVGLGGNDSITVGDGVMGVLVAGGAGNDTIIGGNGNDTLLGGAGPDSLAGGNGNDSLVGGKGLDTLDGGAGADTLAGGGGSDSLTGDAGFDLLLGGTGDNILHGGGGNDTLMGGIGSNTLAGNNGNDSIVALTGTSQLIGGPGLDTLIGGILGETAPDTLISANDGDSLLASAADSLVDDSNDTVAVGNDTVAGTLNFSSTISLLPDQPQRVALADFNGDGKPDAVTLGIHSLYLALNVGGRLGTPQIVGSFEYPVGLAVGDFNGDGKPDIAVGYFPGAASGGHTGKIAIFLGNGNGTFRSSVFATPSPPFSVKTADLTGDGKLDLVTSDDLTDISVYLGNGNGTFQSPVTYVGDPSGISRIALADLNGDGKKDIIVTSNNVLDGGYTGRVDILLNNGNGTFQPAETYATPGLNGRAITVTDFTGDGKPDIAISGDETGGGGNVVILTNNGNGTFTVGTSFAIPISGDSISVADINGDGKPDLVIGGAIPNSKYAGVAVLLGNGNGTFSPADVFGMPTSTNDYFGSFATLITGDINADSRIDIVVADSAGSLIQLTNV